MSDLEQVAAEAVRRALAGGATDAECTIVEGDEFSTNVRMRQTERMKEAGSRGMGIRVLVGRRSGSSYTSDLSSEGIDTMARAALSLAKITTEDPHAGLPDPEELGALAGDLELYDETIAGMDAEWKVAQARRADSVLASLTQRRFSVTEAAGYAVLRAMRRCLIRPASALNGPWPRA